MSGYVTLSHWPSSAWRAALLAGFVARLSGTLRQRDAEPAAAREQLLRDERMDLRTELPKGNLLDRGEIDLVDDAAMNAQLGIEKPLPYGCRLGLGRRDFRHRLDGLHIRRGRRRRRLLRMYASAAQK